MTHEPEARFRELVAAGELRLQRCSRCGEWRWPAREICHNCLSSGAEWVPVRGTGVISSFAVVPSGSRRARPTPYVVVHVELDEGVRFIANLLNVEAGAIRIGMRVRMVLDRSGGEQVMPQFELAASAAP